MMSGCSQLAWVRERPQRKAHGSLFSANHEDVAREQTEADPVEEMEADQEVREE